MELGRDHGPGSLCPRWTRWFRNQTQPGPGPGYTRFSSQVEPVQLLDPAQSSGKDKLPCSDGPDIPPFDARAFASVYMGRCSFDHAAPASRGAASLAGGVVLCAIFEPSVLPDSVYLPVAAGR